MNKRPHDSQALAAASEDRVKRPKAAANGGWRQQVTPAMSKRPHDSQALTSATEDLLKRLKAAVNHAELVREIVGSSDSASISAAFIALLAGGSPSAANGSELREKPTMNGKVPSPPPPSVRCWGGHFKLVFIGDIKAIVDAYGRLCYDPRAQRLRLFDANDQIRWTVPMHRVHQLRSDRFPKGDRYIVRLKHPDNYGSMAECELLFRSPDEAVRLSFHKFILEERGSKD